MIKRFTPARIFEFGIFLAWIIIGGSLWGQEKNTRPSDNSSFVGPKSCQECHPAQYAIWAKSNHALAERTVTATEDQTAFKLGITFKHGTQTSQVCITNGLFEIITLGLGSNVGPHRVERVIGNDPIRQFMTPTTGGRWQVHEAAYAPSSKAWFNVYGDEDRQPGEFGHWTGRGMNWNSQCAVCHNTQLSKNYDAASDSYHTTMVEVGVGCEACHGPLKSHVDWRKGHVKTKEREPSPPLVQRSKTLDVCGACHSRRNELTGTFKPGDSFFDHFSLEILDERGRWYPDGQIKDEDYEFSSFLGSRMFDRDVHCRDCHRVDSGTGNALCLRCHQGKNAEFTSAPVINPAEHGHHKLTDKGGDCIGCHMPTTTYMQRHPRHDHGFGVPDPVLTKELGIPNACARCHEGKTVDWAIETTKAWYGTKMESTRRERTRWIASAVNGKAEAKSPLIKLLTAGRQSFYWRAVEANLLGQWVGDPGINLTLLRCLNDEHPLVREKTVLAMESLVNNDDKEVVSALEERLHDPVRCVRVAAAWVLRGTLDPNSQPGKELMSAMNQDADQPTGQYRLAMFYLARREPEIALVHLQKAVSWDSFSPPLHYQAAMVLSGLGRKDEALKEILQAEHLAPNDQRIAQGKAEILKH